MAVGYCFGSECGDMQIYSISPRKFRKSFSGTLYIFFCERSWTMLRWKIELWWAYHNKTCFTPSNNKSIRIEFCFYIIDTLPRANRSNVSLIFHSFFEIKFTVQMHFILLSSFKYIATSQFAINHVGIEKQFLRHSA